MKVKIDHAKAKRLDRARLRKAGFTLKQVWTHDDDWDASLKYLQKKLAKRIKEGERNVTRSK